MKCAFGSNFATIEQVDSVERALALIAARATGPGTIWVRVSRSHWAIGGNYDAKGQVWNGKSQLVQGRVEDIEYIAKHRN